MTAPVHAPTRILVAALGGEGGGVLAGWISEAAVASGFVVGRTSIPGVAQRTGATTYYIEMMPMQMGAARPILALNPAPGEVDILLASELLEAARIAGTGLVSPDRTTLIASTARVYTMDEKMAMADGRLDSDRLIALLRASARHTTFADLTMIARSASAPLSAVMFGAFAATAACPLGADACRQAIRREGKSVDANIAGFEAGFSMPRSGDIPAASETTTQSARTDAIPGMPARASVVAAEGVARLADYQDRAYADTYLAHLRRFAALPGMSDALLADLARHLAVRMSAEDVIRVAQLKLRAARIARVTAEARARTGDIVDITEFMKPGTEEILGLFPPILARPLLGIAKRLRLDKAALPLTVTTTRFWGHLRLRFLASLRRWRPHTQRFREEQTWLTHWLSGVETLVSRDPDAAREFVATAKLVRGYGDTYARGLANWHRIVTALVEPAIAAPISPGLADQILQARIAAERDPEGTALAATLAAIAQHTETLPQAAQ